MKKDSLHRHTAIGLIVMLATFCLHGNALAQQQNKKCQVSGCVVDSLTKEGEMYATVKITTKENTQDAVKMAATDKDGTFKEWLQKPGDYVITVSSMGRQPIVRQFKVKQDMAAVKLDTLYIQDASNELAGVEVVALKPLVKADIDKIAYDMEDDPDSKTNSVLEMLRKVPLVTVDGEDNIKVNGSTNFKVYVNGRPNNMMSNDPKEVLKSMPACSIKKVEVITNPGPKYDAEGVGGILNIVTVGKGLEGYTATITGIASRYKYGGSVYATVKQGKLTMSGRYGYNYNLTMPVNNDVTRTFTGDPSTPSVANEEAQMPIKQRSCAHSGTLEASYEIDSLRLISVSVDAWGYRNPINSTTLVRATSSIDGSPLYSYDALTGERPKRLFLDGSFDYQRLFKTKDRMLTFSYRISNVQRNGKTETNYINRESTDDWTDFVALTKDQLSDAHARSTEHTFQIDYTTPIAKIHTLETGAKYILRDNRSNSDRYLRSADDAEYSFDDDNSMHYRHRNDILAAYAGYGLNVDNLSGRLGLRYEHTWQNVKYLLGSGQDFKKGFNDFVPSASIGYKISDEQSLRLAYNMRIWRPSITFLDPYLNQTTPSNLSQGNTNLVSEKNHSFEFTYNYFATKFSTSWTLCHSFTNNSIEQVVSLVNDNDINGVKNPTGKMVTYNTYQNIGKSQITSLSGYVSWNIFKNTRFHMNAWVDYSDYNDRQENHNYGWYGSLYVNLQQTLPKDWQISAGFSGWTTNPMLQGTSQGNCYYTINVQKSLLKKKLTISAYAENFFEKTRHYIDTTQTSNFINRKDYSEPAFQYGITVTLRIGELSAEVKKAHNSISNDDVKSGGGK